MTENDPGCNLIGVKQIKYKYYEGPFLSPTHSFNDTVLLRDELARPISNTHIEQSSKLECIFMDALKKSI